jgi:copper homeostasis protein
MFIEVCANSLQSALNAQAGGAGRVELCDNLYEGGTTPSHGTILLAREKLHIKLHVLIRPRGGDFVYSDIEFEVKKKDIEFCKEIACDGVVIGCLNVDGTIDIEKTAEAIKIARPMSVTFHRAFDMTCDPFEALDQLIALGVDRILTSGQKNKAPDGKKLIAELVKRAGDRLVIMPGSGINKANIAMMHEFTGANEFHLTGQKKIESKMKYRKEGIYLGGLPQIPEYEIAETDVETIRNVVAALKG